MDSLRRGHAVQLIDHFAGYSENDPCKEALGEHIFSKLGSFTCFFEAERPCRGGEGSPVTGAAAAAERLHRLGRGEETALYQAVEAYLFRPNAATRAEFSRRESLVRLGGGGSRPGDSLLIGVHVRRGDKIVDAYNRYYTSREYADAIVGWAAAARLGGGGPKTCTVYVASDSATVLGEMQGLLDGTTSGHCRFRVVGQRATVSQQASDSHQFDHVSEISGMAGKVGLLKGQEAWGAAMEIMFDIHTLSKADLLVGTLTSQVGRMAAGLRLAAAAPAPSQDGHDRRFDPIALDYLRWPNVQGMGAGDGIPTPLGERWVPPPGRQHAAATAASRAWEGNTWAALIHTVQVDCKRAAEDVALDRGDGLLSRFQMAVSRAAAALRRGQAVRFVGHFAGYSENELCKQVVGEKTFSAPGTFTCFFEMERACAGAELGTGSPSAESEAAAARLVHIDSENESLFYDGATAYFFAPNQALTAEFMKRKWLARFDEDEYKASGGLLIGVYVNGTGLGGGAWGGARGARHYVRTLLTWAGQSGATAAVARPCFVYVASDGDAAFDDLKASLEGRAAGLCEFRVLGLQGYWAQHHPRPGQALPTRGGEAREVALGLLFDAYMLGRADLLVGLATAQVAQLAARLRRGWNLGGATAHAAIALDYDEVHTGDIGGTINGVPAPVEGWARPPPASP